MNSWKLIDNELINTVDKKSSFFPEKEKSLKNSLKTVVKKQISYSLNSNSIYSRKFVVDIPKEYDFLSQAYVKATLGNGTLSETPEPFLGARIFKKIYLRTKNGTVLQELTPEYTLNRIDELQNTPLYRWTEVGCEPQTNFSDGNVELVIPLFFYFSESQLSFFRTRPLEQCELEFEVNDTAGNMGMTTTLTSASFEFYFKYFDTDDSSRAMNQLDTVKNSSLNYKIPKYLYGSFNIFREDEKTVLAGSTTTRLLLRCPNPTFALHVSLVNSSGKFKQIKNLKIVTGGVDLVDMDYRVNYDLFNNKQSFGGVGTTTLWFSKNKSRTEDSGLIVFSKAMHPSYLELEFDSLDSDYILKTYCEHRTLFAVSEQGFINFSTDFEGSLMDQMNTENSASFIA